MVGEELVGRRRKKKLLRNGEKRRALGQIHYDPRLDKR